MAAFEGSQLHIEVFDKQRSARFTRPVFIGGGVVELGPNLLDASGKTRQVTLKLVDTRAAADQKPSKLPSELGQIVLELRRAQEDSDGVSDRVRRKKLSRRGSGSKSYRTHEVVTVDVLRARGLPAMDPNGKADPYAKLSIGDDHRKTRVIFKSLEPEWLDRFEFNVRSDPILLVDLFDKDVIGSDDYIGSVQLNLSNRDEYPLEQTSVAWYPLARSEVDSGLGINFGEIELGITVVDMFDDSKIKVDAAGESKHNAELHIKVCQAKGLPVCDANGSSDPYAVVEVEDTRVRTATVFHSLFPKWSRRFVIPVHDVWRPLTVNIYDEDAGSKDNDFMGGVKLNMNKLSTTGKARWYTLKKQGYGAALPGGGAVEIEAKLIWKPKCYSVLLAPKQKNYLSRDEAFKFSLLSKNISRFTAGIGSVTYAMNSIVGLMEWRFGFFPSFVTLLVWWKIFFYGETVTSDICAVLACLYAYRGYLYSKVPKEMGAGDFCSAEDEEFDSDDDDIDSRSPKKGSGKGQSKTLVARYKAMMDLAESANGIIDGWASIFERWKNVFKWKSKFISLLFCTILLLLSLLLWLVQGHFNLVMLFAGSHKLLKMGLIKYGYMHRKPAHMRRGLWFLNAVKRVPSNAEIEQCRRLKPLSKTRRVNGK